MIQEIQAITGVNEETAQYIATMCNNNPVELSRFPRSAMRRVPGMTEKRCDKLLAALQLSRSIQQHSTRDRPKITKSRDAYDLMKHKFEHLAHEEVWLLPMNQAATVIDEIRVSQGGMTGAVVDPKIVMRELLIRRATRFILLHNHPSGNVRPSQQDIKLTQKLKHCAQLHDMEITDHIIVSSIEDRYFSLLDEGMIY